MKAVFAAAQLAHSPTRFLSLGNIVDYPDKPDRARRLLEGARRAEAQIYAARTFETEVLERCHAREYLEFLEGAYAEWSQIEGAGPELMPSLRPLVAPTRAPRHILGRAGLFLMDFSCPITDATWKAVRASAATALTAADLVLKGDRVVYALCRPPGHHAYADMAAGFCYLNNAALAAEQLRTVHERVAVLDIDCHHGNGTQSIFYERGDVLTVSIHANPLNFYPFYWGYPREKGAGDGVGCNLNIPVGVGAGNEAWLAALGEALGRIAEFEPGALVVAVGFDAHEADPLQGGTVTTECYATMAQRIAALELPTVLVQEGGYAGDHLADNLAAFLTAFEQPPATEEAAAPPAEAAETA
jgi:acetoin utilization deacetylase AcuC-like enzyme